MLPKISFFTDRNLGKQFPQILRQSGLQVELHDDYFEQMTDDQVWLEVAGQNQWIVITKDQRIRYRPNERDAVMHNGVALIVLIGKVTHRLLAQNFVNTKAVIYEFLKQNQAPFIAKLYLPGSSENPEHETRTGRISLWLGYKEWTERPGQT